MLVRFADRFSDVNVDASESVESLYGFELVLVLFAALAMLEKLLVAGRELSAARAPSLKEVVATDECTP